MKPGDKVKYVGHTECGDPRYDCKDKKGVLIEIKVPSSSPDEIIWKVKFPGDAGVRFISQKYLIKAYDQLKFAFAEG